MLTYRRETIAAIKDEILPLLDAHWREIALDQDTVKLDPDWATYDVLDQIGALLIVTARHEGTLVGYAVYLISQNIHYKNLRGAENDLYWLDPVYRKGRAGIELFRAAEFLLAGEGVQKVTHKVKLDHDVGRVFERLGYKPIERIYIKTLEGC